LDDILKPARGNIVKSTTIPVCGFQEQLRQTWLKALRKRIFGNKKAAKKRLFYKIGRTKQTRTADPHHVKVVL
jgi:hypothetical protein